MNKTLNYPELGKVAHGVYAGLYPGIILSPIPDMDSHIQQVFAAVRMHEPRLTIDMAREYFATTYSGNEELSHELSMLVYESFMLRITADTYWYVRHAFVDVMTISGVTRGALNDLLALLEAKTVTA